MLKLILHIIPKPFRSLSIRYLLLSLINVFLDLLSIAYIIPLFIFILDETKIPDFVNKLPFFNSANLYAWVIGGIVLFILKNIIQTFIIKFQSRLVFDIATELSFNLASDFLKKPFSELQNINKGKELHKIQMSGTEFANNILLSINYIFTEALVILILLTVSLFLYPILTLYILCFALICLLSLYFFKQRKIKNISASIKKRYASTSSNLLNILNGFLEIRSLKKEDYFELKFKKSLKKFNANFVQLKTIQNSNIKYLEIFLIIGLSFFIIFIKNLADPETNRIVLTSFIAGISLKLFPSLNKIILSITNIKSFSYTIGIFKDSNSKKNLSYNTKPFKNTLELRNISFGYNPSKLILDSVNLTINKGEIIAIKGKSGIGKTTLLNIILGMITPSSGEKYLDNTLLKREDLLFNIASYVPQHPFIFNGTILENIVIGTAKKDIDSEKIAHLLETFQLTDYLNNLPDKLETKLSHDSLTLSGGQKQRIALIRALYSNPELLILDEATNQLDDALEASILTYLKNRAKENNFSIIIASHSTNIDKIIEKSYDINTFKKDIVN